VSKASGKLEGIELALKASCSRYIFLDAYLFGYFFVKQCRVEETPAFFISLFVTMF